MQVMLAYSCHNDIGPVDAVETIYPRVSSFINKISTFSERLRSVKCICQ